MRSPYALISALATALALLVAFPTHAIAAEMVALGEAEVRVEKLDNDLTLHTFYSHGFAGHQGAVATQIFESNDGLLVFDAQMYKAAALELKAYLQNLNKPVERIIISHAHSDHTLGLAYLDGVATASNVYATSGVIAEHEQTVALQLGFFAQILGDVAADILPIDNPPKIPNTLELGNLQFGNATFELSELATHESQNSLFVLIPKHRLLMIFDAITPNIHLAVFSPIGPLPGSLSEPGALTDTLNLGFAMFDTMDSIDSYDRILVGHSIEPGTRDLIAPARESLNLFAEVAKKTDNAEAFIQMVSAAKPQWGADFVGLLASQLYPPQ
ncbi:MAG: MBL fold metallo-hydrolase [Alphaproteobacteria bacterium]